MKKIYIQYSIMIIFLLIIDILSKNWILNNLKLYETKKILSVLNLFHIHNYGIAFSILSNKTLWNQFFLSILSTIIIFIIFKKILKSKKKYKILAYCLIISGAIGNLIDRVFHGFIIDFIDIHINTWHFATFNISDFIIFLGIIIYIKNQYKIKKK